MLEMFKNIYHYFLSYLGSIFYRHPSRALIVVGVTGTKGKSTTLEIINAILEAAGEKTALLSSVRMKVGETSEKNMTCTSMPGRFFIQRFLRRAVNAGCRYALLEVTSQGVLQHRHRFIDFDSALVTNLHAEHIESHGGFAAYRNAKCKFFSDLRFSTKPQKYFFINQSMRLEDRKCFETALRGIGSVVFYSRAEFLNIFSQGSLSPFLQFDTNIENAAAATAFALHCGISRDSIFHVLAQFPGVPGRMEYVQVFPFAVVIDYAHTSVSLEAAYRAVKPLRGKLIAVLGAAGGGRDVAKRKEFGRIAAEYCNEIVLTNEDPYDEFPGTIIKNIEEGFCGGPSVHYEIVLDRKDAIAKAIGIASPGDVVIMTGKGSESWMHVAHGKKIAWDERAVVEEVLRRMAS